MYTSTQENKDPEEEPYERNKKKSFFKNNFFTNVPEMLQTGHAIFFLLFFFHCFFQAILTFLSNDQNRKKKEKTKIIHVKSTYMLVFQSVMKIFVQKNVISKQEGMCVSLGVQEQDEESFVNLFCPPSEDPTPQATF